MPRFAMMLKSAYEARGHSVSVWSPQAWLHTLFASGRYAKWAGYFDQYVVFPFAVRRRLKTASADSLFVFCDQALGPWVPLVQRRPHVIHVHDLLALRSALGYIPENRTSLTGRVYQKYIRRGFKRGQHFIAVSKKTRDDLHRFGEVEALTSEVVYNGLNFPFSRLSKDEARAALIDHGLPEAPDGMVMHIGGNQWYKNLPGVIRIYAKYASQEARPLPLWCISPKPTAAVQQLLSNIPKNARVRFFPGVENRVVQACYSIARALLFPSLEEGFGWPLVEAQSCGCPVITTDQPPMNEIAGNAAVYLPRLRMGDDVDSWASAGAAALATLLKETHADQLRRSEFGRNWALQFDGSRAIDRYLEIYAAILGSPESRAMTRP